MSAEGYLLDNRATEAEDRFTALSSIFDPVTFRHVDALGVGPGWQCSEVGAGGPSLPDGLAARVGPRGRVVATDLETRLLVGRIRPEVEVVRHDVVRDEPPGERFGLVHARLVLLHVPEREEALRRMVSALRPDTRQVRDGLVDRAGVPAADVDRYPELAATGALDLVTAPLVSAWGQRPQR